jgi:hypothetical protein
MKSWSALSNSQCVGGTEYHDLKGPNKTFEPIAYAPAQLCVSDRQGAVV